MATSSTRCSVRGEAIDVAGGGLIYRDERVSMQPAAYGLETGLFGGAEQLVINRFTGPGRVGIQSAYAHLATES